MRQRLDDALGLDRRGQLEEAMHAYYDDVQVRQLLVSDIEAAIFEDVYLHAAQYPDVVPPCRQRCELRMLTPQLLVVQTALQSEGPAVIRHGHVLVTQRRAGSDHRLQAVAPVGPGRMHV